MHISVAIELHHSSVYINNGLPFSSGPRSSMRKYFFFSSSSSSSLGFYGIWNPCCLSAATLRFYFPSFSIEVIVTNNARLCFQSTGPWKHIILQLISAFNTVPRFEDAFDIVLYLFSVPISWFLLSRVNFYHFKGSAQQFCFFFKNSKLNILFLPH